MTDSNVVVFVIAFVAGFLIFDGCGITITVNHEKPAAEEQVKDTKNDIPELAKPLPSSIVAQPESYKERQDRKSRERHKEIQRRHEALPPELRGDYFRNPTAKELLEAEGEDVKIPAGD